MVFLSPVQLFFVLIYSFVVVAEDIGELIIIFDVDNEMAHCAIVSVIIKMRILIIVIKHSLC